MYEPFLVDDEGKPLPVPSGDITDAPIVCVPVSQDWIPTLTGALAYLEKQKSWGAVDDTELDRALANLSTLLSLIQGASECIEPMTLEHDIIIAHHHAANNTAGGGTTAGTFTSMPITRIFQDTTGVVTLAGSKLTIPAGRWNLEARHVFRDASAHLARIKVAVNEVGAPGTLVEYYSDNGRSAVDSGSKPQVSLVLDYAVDWELRWQYFINVAEATNGLGVPNNNGTDEIYGVITLERVRLQ